MERAAVPPRTWRDSQVLRRLPLLVLAAVGLWLWESSRTPQRELVLLLEGSAWAQVRSLEVQVVAPGGEVLKREERFFTSEPPRRLTLEAALPAGTYRLLVFAREAGGPAHAPLVRSWTLGEEPSSTHALHLAQRR